MANFTPEFVYEKLGFSPLAQRAMPSGGSAFKAVVTDSRKIEPGCLFVAIQGEKFDGHEFIPAAIQKGARGILCRKGTQVPAQKDLHVFQVEDTLQAYRKLAAAWRREFPIPVVAVAGSVGKTTTKEILSAILRGKWPNVLRTQGSQNGFVGIPMTLLDIRPEHGAAVVEVGIDEIGAMEAHMPVINATAAVLTAIAPEHLEKLIDLPTVAREEGVALTSVAGTGGFVAVNLDDAWIRPHFNTLRNGRKLGYTLLAAPGAKAPENALAGLLTDGARELEVLGLEGPASRHAFVLPLPGKHNAGNLLAAIAVAHGLGLTPDEMRRGLQTFAGAEGRSELRELAGGTPVVCDYYNASPASMEAGFEMVTDIARQRARAGATRWACLGDMLELGAGEEGFHRGLADSLLRLGIEHVLLYGPRMQALRDELKNRGYAGTLSHHATHAELAQALLGGATPGGGAKPGDAVLIKGSRGMKMEEVWKRLSESWKA